MHSLVRAAACLLTAGALLVPLGAARAGDTLAPPGSTAAYAKLQALARDLTFGWAKTHPLEATELGLDDEDGELDVPSAESRANDLARVHAWQAELAAIPLDGATLVERDDAALLAAELTHRERELALYKRDEKDYSAPAQAILNAVYTQFQHVPVPGENGATQADVATAWSRIVARMRKAPAYIVAGQKLVTHPGRLFGMVGEQQLEGAKDFYDGPLTDAAKGTLGPKDFAAFVAARDALDATTAQTLAYLKANASGWPENYAIGRAAYDAMLKDEQLLPYDSSDVIGMGRDELAHGWAEQVWLEHDAAVAKTALGAQSGGGMAPAGEAIVPYYRARIDELTAFVKSHDVVTIPPWLGTVQVVETPKFLQPVQPGASMDPPRLFARETGGFYNITPPKSLDDAAKRLDLYTDFDRDRIWSTAAHEVMPGHYLQFSIARRHPDFVRKIQFSGVFAEGWAYYGEEMFVRLGLYGDTLDGRLDVAQWERIRGCRAIVDAELASGDWDYRKAADFFAAQTGTTKGEADAAVAGIALSPGYVISYTVGRLQLENLLTQYRAKVGDRASLHDFHDRLLSYGTTPYAIVGPELMADLDKPAAAVRAAANY